MMIERVILGWDGRADSAEMVRWIARYLPGRPILLVTVSTDRAAAAHFFEPDSEAARARTSLMDAADRLRSAFPDAVIESQTVGGEVLDELAGFLGESQLLVLGAHGRHHWSAGSRLAAGMARGAIAVVPEIDQHGRDREIVVGFDDSIASAAALDTAIELAGASNSRVRIVHCWAPPRFDFEGVATSDEIHAVKDAHRRILDVGVTVARNAGVDAVGELQRGDATVTLSSRAARADLLIIGNRSHLGFARLFLGSVAQALVTALPSPVIVVAPSEPAPSRHASGERRLRTI